VTPHQCRLRDLTYSAPLYVDVEYTQGRKIQRAKKVCIGRVPIMLRSRHCVLAGKTERQLADYDECPHDPGGYFVVKGQEKVVLIQEQLSKNRIIVERDSNKNVIASVTSSTHERKSRTNVVMVHGRVRLKHNSLTENIPIVIAFKAMGVTSDQEIVSMVGTEPEILAAMAASLEEAATLKVFSQRQALAYIGSKVKGTRRMMGQRARRDPVVRIRQHARALGLCCGLDWGVSCVRLFSQEEARSVLERLVICHVAVNQFNFRPKCIYMARMVRRVLLTIAGVTQVDDKVRATPPLLLRPLASVSRGFVRAAPSLWFVAVVGRAGLLWKQATGTGGSVAVIDVRGFVQAFQLPHQARGRLGAAKAESRGIF